LNLEKVGADTNAINGKLPKFQSSDGYQKIMEMSLIQSIIPVLATYGIAPKPAKHLKKYSPQLWAIHEDMVLKNPQYDGKFEKAR
jgi:hypothetical protein